MGGPREAGRPELADFHRKVLMDDMMQVVGVDLLDAIDVDGGQGYVRARASCHGCTGKVFCRDWLAEHREACRKISVRTQNFSARSRAATADRQMPTDSKSRLHLGISSRVCAP